MWYMDGVMSEEDDDSSLQYLSFWAIHNYDIRYLTDGMCSAEDDTVK